MTPLRPGVPARVKQGMDGVLTPGEFASSTGVSRETLGRLVRYADLLTKWQTALNLVSHSTLSDLWRRHMLDSAQLAPLVSPLPAGRLPLIADLGSGAGFPGLVLAIVTGCPVELFEADARKCAFLREAVRVTGSSATVINMRLTASNTDSERRCADVVVARALAPLDRLCAMAWPFRPRSCLFPKGVTWAEELTAARKHWIMDAEAFESATLPSSRILRLSRIHPLNPEPGAPRVLTPTGN